MIHKPSTMSDRWKKLKDLGSGSFGSVSLAGKLDSFGHTTSLAAVKSSVLTKASSLQFEAKLLHKLKGHANIVRCFGEDLSIENNEEVYNLLLEYASKGTLDNLIKSYNRPMPELLVAFYAYQLLQGLSYLHGKGIVHCDIKPKNILLFPSQDARFHQLKIADFGLAKKSKSVSTIGVGQRRVYGTPGYASPESICYGEDKTPRDIWSLGCTLLKMFTGQDIWYNVDTEDLLDQIVQIGPIIPSWISEEGKDLLERCLEKDPLKRWTAEALLKHPFILKNLLPLSAQIGSAMSLVYQLNPFGSSSFASTKGLFSTTRIHREPKINEKRCCEPLLLPHQVYAQSRLQQGC